MEAGFHIQEKTGNAHAERTRAGMDSIAIELHG